MAEVYRVMASHCSGLDWSVEAELAAFAFESTGQKSGDLARNGFLVGKHWANVQVDEWKAGIAEGLFLRQEFIEDPALPRWWVEEVLRAA